MKELVSICIHFEKSQYENLQKQAFTKGISLSEYIRASLKPSRQRNFVYSREVRVFADSIRRKTQCFLDKLEGRNEIIGHIYEGKYKLKKAKGDVL